MIIQKIFSFDKALAGKGSHNVLIVQESTPKAAELQKAFSAVGFATTVLPLAKVEQGLGDASAVYVGDSISPALAAATERNKILTIASNEGLADKGQVAVALSIAGGKPQIVVSLKRLEAEGHKFSAELLALARVVR